MRGIWEQEKLHLVIHYDPVATDDPRVAVMRVYISEIAAQIHPEMTVHDLRIVPGNSHTNVVFDCVVPYGFDMPGKEIRRRIQERIQKDYPDYGCVITLENSFVHDA